MKRKGFFKCISVVLTLCMMLSCISFSFATVSAAEVEGGAEVSAANNGDNFSWDNASVYFLLTDRFKNGNTSNDHSYNRGLDENGNVVSGIDERATFHGGDFAGVTQAINDGYFTNLGVNAIWISAPYEQLHGYVVGDDSSPSFAHYSYHGYYVLDYTQTDANFGTAEEFETLVDTAHSKGIRVILDIVMNHAGYNSLYDMDEYGFGTVKTGWENDYFSHKNISNKLYHSYIDYDNNAADWAKWWGPDWIRCGVAGYTNGGGDDLTKTLAGLPDFKTDSTKTVGIPEHLKTKWTKEGRLAQETSELSAYLSKTGKSQTVTNTISYWLSSWVREYGVDGFRCDTAKHVDLPSWKTLKDTCVDALKEWRQNNPSKPGANWDEDFWMTGECWDHNIGWGYDSYYTQGGFDSMINFETQGGGLLSMSRLDGVYSNYASSINSNDKFNQLSYLSSHDSTLARGDMITTGSAFLLLPGGVQIYYGDETNRPLVSGIPNDGNGGAGHSLRSDMNWDSMDEKVLSHWQKVGSFRNNHISVGAGDHQQITAYNQSTGYTFSRSYDNGEVSDNIIATIGAPANKDLAVDVASLWSDGTTVTNAYDGKTATVTDGKATFNTGANGTILIEGPVSTISMSLKGAYSFYDSQQLTVALRGADYAMVSINGGAEFKVVNGDTFSVGEGIEIGATFKVTMTASNAEETATKYFTYKKKDPNAVIRVYFDNSKYKWSTVNAYIYDESSENTIKNKEWPGEAMAYDSATGFYMIEVPDELTNGRIMFNAGKDSSNRYPGDGEQGLAINETNMLFSYGNTWVPYTNQTVDPTEPTTPPDPTKTTTVYFDNSSKKFSTPTIYYWSSATNQGPNGWPGVAMTKVSGDIWKATFDSKYDKCIFSDNGGNQTGDLSVPGNNYIHNGSSWAAYEVPTEPTTVPPTTVPVTTAPVTTTPVVTVPQTTAPVTTAPVTTAPVTTAPTTAVPTNELTVNATSNIFPAVSKTVNKNDGTVTVTYKLTANMKSVNAQWALTYDNTKLEYKAENNTVNGSLNIMPAVGDKLVFRQNGNVLKGNFTTTSMVNFGSNADFVTVKFNIIGTGEATVDLRLEVFSLGYRDASNSLKTASIVDDGIKKNISGISGFENASISVNTVINEVLVPTNELTVNATSNIFPAVSKTVNKDDGTVTVTYKLTANMKAVNAQWTLTYDDTKLEYKAENNAVDGTLNIMPVAKDILVFRKNGNVLKGNFTTTSMVEFGDNADFVTVKFNIIGTGEATVDLRLEVLSLGYKDASYNIKTASIVDGGVKKNISGISGFEKASITVNTVINEVVDDVLIGDANQDGVIDVKDVTFIQRAIVNETILPARQKKASDTNRDGVIDIKDATRIQQYLVGSFKEF